MKDLIQKSGVTLPPKIVLYGEEKIGKSTFGSQAPNPIFLDIEGGLDYIKPAVDKTPIIKSSKEFLDWLTYLANEEHNYKTLVIDSIDWLEEIIGNEVAKAHGATSISDSTCKSLSYGAGYGMLRDKMSYILKCLDALREKRKMTLILIAHSQVRIVNSDPIDDEYQTYELKLNKQVSAKLKEWADIILFARHQKYVAENKTLTGDRILVGDKQAAFAGGGRVEIPQIPFNYKSFKEKYKEITNYEV